MNGALYVFMARRGLTQDDFAALLGVDRSQISRYIDGGRTPKLALVLEIDRLTKGAVPPKSWLKKPKKQKRRAA